MDSKVISNLLFIGLIFTSFFWWPWAQVPFEVPKVEFFEYFVKILALVFGYKVLTKQTVTSSTSKIFYIVILFSLWVVITGLLGVNILKSFAGNYYRNDGLITLFHLVGFAFLIGYFWQEKLKQKIALAFFTSSVGLALTACYEILLGTFGIGSAATFGNPNFLAGFLAVALPFGYYLFVTQKNSWYLVGSIITVISILMIGAVSAILTLTIYLIILTTLHFKAKIKYIFIFLLILSAGTLSTFWIKDYYSKNSESFIAEGRVRIYRNVLVGITNSPIVGYGWANIDKAFESNVWPLKFNNDVYVDKAHSELLEITATTGIPGLIIYLILVGTVFRKLIKSFKTSTDKNWEITLISILILFLFHSQTNVISISEQIVFWLIVGIAMVDFGLSAKYNPLK